MSCKTVKRAKYTTIKSFGTVRKKERNSSRSERRQYRRFFLLGVPLEKARLPRRFQPWPVFRVQLTVLGTFASFDVPCLEYTSSTQPDRLPKPGLYLELPLPSNQSLVLHLSRDTK